MRGPWVVGFILVLASSPTAPRAAPSPPDVRAEPRARTPAVEVRQYRYARVGFSVVRVDLRQADLRLVRQAAGGRTLSTFEALAAAMAAEGRPLLAATNAGIFKHGASNPPTPEGLFVQDGVELSPLNQADGQGNFYWKPQGVFFVREGGAGIVTSERFQREGVLQATQSGPLLFDPSGPHEGFDQSLSSKERRNAVGVDARDPSRVFIVLAHEPSRFQTLAEFMRDALGCTSALYLDGVISGLWTPEATADGATRSEYAGFLAVTARHGPRGSLP